MNFIPQTQTRTPYVPVESTTLNFLSITEHSVANLINFLGHAFVSPGSEFFTADFCFFSRILKLKVIAIFFVMVIYQSCSIKNNISVISSKFINKFVQKCHCYNTLSDQSIPLVTVTVFPRIVSALE